MTLGSGVSAVVMVTAKEGQTLRLDPDKRLMLIEPETVIGGHSWSPTKGTDKHRDCT